MTYGPPTLFDRLGGAPALAALAGALLARLQGEPELAHLFSPAAGGGPAGPLHGVLAVALGRPAAMAGMTGMDGMTATQPAVDDRHLTHRQFCLFAAHLLDVLTDAGTAEDDVATVMTWVHTARPAVVAGERPA
ncbi:MAG: hypothetical protein R2694_15715 [Ilumatobacteraceae bacterium]